MAEQQGVDINEVALENIVPMSNEGEPAPLAMPAPINPEPLPANTTTEPTTPATPDQAATAQDPQQTPEPDTPQTEEPPAEPTAEPQGTGALDDPIKIETTAEPGAPGDPGPEAPEPDFDEAEQMDIFNDHLAGHTDNQIQSVEDINNLIAENERLRNQPQQPEFTSESAKQLYEFANNSSNPLAMGKNYLQAVALDLESLSDKQKLFEAYVLDEQNSDLTREKAIEYFNEDYEEKYGEIEDSLSTQRKLTLDVRAAENQIKSIQQEATNAQTKDGNNADQATPEQLEEINGNINESIEQMAALSIPATDDNVFNFEVSGQENIDLLSNVAQDPMAWLQEEINAFQNPNTGQFDYDGYNAFIGSLLFSGQIAEGMFKHGQNNGTKAVVENLQNPARPGGDPSTLPVADNRNHQDKIWDAMAEKMENY
jgi:hypothetical protein